MSKEERDRLRDAILGLQQRLYPGLKTDPIPGGVSYWFKQDEIHAGTHVHFCPAFLPWHRELVNRFEALIRQVDPELSLHYWDWTADPQKLTDSDGNALNLFTRDFMGNAVGPAGALIEIGDPWLTAGFYGGPGPYRDTTNNPADPPQIVQRQVGVNETLINPVRETALLNSPDFVAFDASMEDPGDPTAPHNQAHGYVGGNLAQIHLSFRDPFVFLLHCNVDRLFAVWQRQPGHSERLDPTQLYKAQSTNHNGYENTLGGDRTTVDPPQAPVPGDNTVSSLHPWWAILSPEEPWAGGMIAETAATGIIQNVASVRPWTAPENQQIFKDSRDPSIVIPRSYDTAPHSSYFIINRDTFSNSEVATLGSPASFSNAFYLIYEGFQPKELGAASSPLPAILPNLPNIRFSVPSLSAVKPQVSYEDPSGAIDMPQRIMIAYDLSFANSNDFPPAAGGELGVVMNATLNYQVNTGTGGAIVNVNEVAIADLLLVNQPNPYMIHTMPGDPSPVWLSVDTRVFQVKNGDVIGSGPAGPAGPATQGDLDSNPNAPFTFIQQVLKNFNSIVSDNNHPFLTQLSEDETASQLELSQKVGGRRVYNYAIAKVRYRAPAGVNASNVSAFFRSFSTAVSAIDYDATSGNTGNFRRNGNNNGTSVPLLGIENDSQGQPETASIPFFASPRVDSSIASMTTQTPDLPNIQTINGSGSESVAYFGAWLDINLAPGDPNFRQFPFNPLDASVAPSGPDGPFLGSLQSIQQHMLGTHQCLVAEIFFWPAGTVNDPIPYRASPASSDRLAQRNLVLVRSGNPGYPATHTVQTTFIVKASTAQVIPIAALGANQQAPVQTKAKHPRRGKSPQIEEAVAVVSPSYRGPDELLIRWNNVPRATTCTLFLPEIDVDEIISLSNLRQHPAPLQKIDTHTLRCPLADISFIPLPPRNGTLVGLITIVLPKKIRSGQVYRLSVEQYSGYTHKTMGAFQITIPVQPDSEILPSEIRKLSIMKYVQQAIPAGSRWRSIFARFIDQLAARVQGFGGDPNAVKPSPSGDEGGILKEPCPKEMSPSLKICLDLPMRKDDDQAELDLKLHFRRRARPASDLSTDHEELES